MMRLRLLRLEAQRALATQRGWKGIGGTLAGAVLLALVATRLSIGAAGTSALTIVPVLGAAWSSMAAVHAIDRNRGALIEDIWFALEPGTRPQLTALFFAWLPIAYFQALATSLAILALRPEPPLAVLGLLHLSFAAAIPAGLLMSALARHISGFSLLSGVGFVVVILFAQMLGEAVGTPTTASMGMAIAGYLAITLLGFGLLTRKFGRSR